MNVVLHTRGAARRMVSVLILAFVSAGLLACQSSIEIVQPAAAPVLAVTTVVPAAHDVAIIGVDFDPPLNYDQIISNGGVTLLVAVRNLGLTAESHVAVNARLLDPAAPATQGDLLNETVIVKSLAAGTVQVVRFNQASVLPLRKQYALVVELAPVPGERALNDNSRSYDILVHGME